MELISSLKGSLLPISYKSEYRRSHRITKGSFKWLTVLLKDKVTIIRRKLCTDL